MKGPDLQGHLGAIWKRQIALSEFWDAWLDESPQKLDWKRGVEAHTRKSAPCLPVATHQMGKPKQDLALWSYHLGKEKETLACASKQEPPSVPLCSQRPPLCSKSQDSPGAQQRHSCFISLGPPRCSLLTAQKCWAELGQDYERFQLVSLHTFLSNGKKKPSSFLMEKKKKSHSPPFIQKTGKPDGYSVLSTPPCAHPTKYYPGPGQRLHACSGSSLCRGRWFIRLQSWRKQIQWDYLLTGRSLCVHMCSEYFVPGTKHSNECLGRTMKLLPCI